MADPDLRAVLRELHDQLETSATLDPALRRDLRHAVAEIEERLEETGADEDAGLGDRLAGLVERFEGSHPRLAEALGRVIHGLAELGI